MRFFAFLGVFVFHCTPIVASVLRPGLAPSLVLAATRAGAFGVDLFFTLSAYLITELISREREELGRADLHAFYVRRCLRIWPLYYAMLALFALSMPGLSWFVLGSYLTFVGNFIGAVALSHGAMAPLWSISVEEQFYLVWPALARRSTRANLLKAGLILWAAALAGRVLLSSANILGLALWYNSIAHLDSIAAGVILSAARLDQLHLRWRGPLIIAGAGLWLIVGWFVPREFDTTVSAVLLFPLVAPGSMALVAGAARSPMLRAPALRYLGRISYGLYLFHMPVLAVCISHLGPRRFIIIPLGLALTLGLSALSYRYFETPFLRLKSRWQRVASGPKLADAAPARDRLFDSPAPAAANPTFLL